MSELFLGLCQFGQHAVGTALPLEQEVTIARLTADEGGKA
jgi:hypothetical protein